MFLFERKFTEDVVGLAIFCFSCILSIPFSWALPHDHKPLLLCMATTSTRDNVPTSTDNDNSSTDPNNENENKEATHPTINLSDHPIPTPLTIATSQEEEEEEDIIDLDNLATISDTDSKADEPLDEKMNSVCLQLFAKPTPDDLDYAQKNKMDIVTRPEVWAWYLYDAANSAFAGAGLSLI